MFEATANGQTVPDILEEKGVTFLTDNVEIGPDPNCGLMATDTIQPNHVVLKGEMTFALELDQGQDSIEKLPTKASIHCHLAVQLTSKLTQPQSKWKVPDISHYKDRFPILWGTNQASSLDEEAKECLQIQKIELEGDWECARETCGLRCYREALVSDRSKEEDMFLRAWLYIESKAYVDPRKEYFPHTLLDNDPQDWQILFPVVDYFSFGRRGCTVHVNDGEYWFTTTREYEKGERIDLKCVYTWGQSLVTFGRVSPSGGRLSPIMEESSPTRRVSFIGES